MPVHGRACAGTKPSWATSKALVRHASPTQTVGFRIYLGWRNGPAAEALAAAVSNPRSSSYRHFLSPTQFRAQFAPTAADAAAVQNWLKASGFKVTDTPANRHFIAAQGTVKQVEAAFQTTLNIYRASGQDVRAPSTTLSVPASIAGKISGAIGIDESYNFVHTNTVIDKKAPPSEGFRNAPPLSTYWAQFVSPYAYPTGFTDMTDPATAPWTVRGYTPAQIKGAYGISGAYNGAGQTVGDHRRLRLTDHSPGRQPVVDEPRTSDDEQRTVQAGRATGRLPSPAEPPAGSAGLVRRGNARHRSRPWHGPGGEHHLCRCAEQLPGPRRRAQPRRRPPPRPDRDELVRLAGEFLPPGFIRPIERHARSRLPLEGIGVYFSSGDNGDETSVLGVASTDFPASSPWVTAVGGTSLGVSQANTRALETGWGTRNYACDSTTHAVHAHRLAVRRRRRREPGVRQAVVSAASLNPTGRGSADVAALGDPQTGLLIGQTQTFPDGAYYDEYRIGGTSLASPIFAGLMALADQAAGHAARLRQSAVLRPRGRLLRRPSIKTAVARRNFDNSVDAERRDRRTASGRSTTIPARPTQITHAGWDNVTGLGTPTRELPRDVRPLDGTPPPAGRGPQQAIKAAGSDSAALHSRQATGAWPHR